MLVIHLGEAGRELARAGTGRRHDHERALRLDELIAPIALLRDDEVDVVRISLDGIVQLARDAEHREATAEDIRRGLSGVLREHHAATAMPLLLKISARRSTSSS